MEHSSSKIKEFLILYNPNLKMFPNFTTPTLKFFLQKISYIFFGEKPALKNFLIFWEMELSCPSLKNSYISGRNLQNLKSKNLSYFFKKVIPNFRMIADQFACFFLDINLYIYSFEFFSSENAMS